MNKVEHLSQQEDPPQICEGGSAAVNHGGDVPPLDDEAGEIDEKQLSPTKSFSSPSKIKEGEDLAVLRQIVTTRVEAFDESQMGEGQATEWKGDSMGFCQLAGKETNACDMFLLVFGSVFAVLFGTALPLIFLLFADIIDGFGGAAASETSIDKNVKASDAAKS